MPKGSVAVFHAAPERSGVSTDPYRQDSDFWYLTGLEESSAIALFDPAASRDSARFVLFVQPKDFADEQWTGWRAGVQGAKKDYGAGEAYPVASFWEYFGRVAPAAQSLYFESGGDEGFGKKLLETWNAANGNARRSEVTGQIAEVRPKYISLQITVLPHQSDL